MKVKKIFSILLHPNQKIFPSGSFYPTLNCIVNYVTSLKKVSVDIKEKKKN